MYTLYYSPGACSMAVHVLLNELGADFKLEKVALDGKANTSPEYKKLNPRGQVPVLVVDGQAIKEGGALLNWLADTHGKGWLPKDGMARAKALEWLAWANASLHPAYSRAFWMNKTFKDEAQKAEMLKAQGAAIQSLWDEAEARLSQSRYLGGDDISPADILVCVIANWSVVQPAFGPNVKKLLREVTSRPAYQKALEAEGIDYKAAA